MYRLLVIVNLAIIALCQIQQSDYKELIAMDYQANSWTGKCNDGKSQSPIDLQVDKGQCYAKSSINISFNTKIKSKPTLAGQHLIMEGQFGTMFATNITMEVVSYYMTHILVKIPSEHKMQGKRYDMELQLCFDVHKQFSYDANKKAVVSLLLNKQQGSEHQLVKYMIDNFGVEQDINMKTILGSTIPAKPVFFNYQGSKTYFPCDEVVEWYIINYPFHLTPAQFDSLMQIVPTKNARSIQNTQGRLVIYGGFECYSDYIYFFSFFIVYVFVCYLVFMLL